MTAHKLDPLLPVPGRPIMVVVMAFCHLVALLALIPYFFSWTGVILAVVGSVLSVFGINICYHRLLAHWPAPGSEDTELGVLVEPEVGHGEAKIYAGIQA